MLIMFVYAQVESVCFADSPNEETSTGHGHQRCDRMRDLPLFPVILGLF